MKKKKIGILALILLLFCMLDLCMMHFFRWNMQVSAETFTESNRELSNPNTGFYHIYGFVMKDAPEDYPSVLSEKMQGDTRTIAMMQINLREYRNKPLTDEALTNMESLFQTLSETDKTWIVRFLYDWDGKNLSQEPKKISIITNHMQQLSPILKKYKDCMFTMQGLFVGNWGELNGTKYSDTKSIRILARKLEAVTDKSTFLSVRTPAQWRRVTKQMDPSRNKTDLEHRMGLFNDGMLGNKGDYGTYGTQSQKQGGSYAYWTRKEELAFQQKLCTRVPNGGEVIHDNIYNDLPAAIADLKTMHVTYLNEEYDQNVLNKWAASTVHTSDCFDGMDGLTYIERHLGYRIFLSDAEVSYHMWKDTLHVKASFQNAGFAPIYKACDGMLTVKNEQGEIVYQKKTDADFKKLPGGNQAKKKLTISDEIPLRGVQGKTFTVYFSLKDRASGKMITFANEQEPVEEGYPLGKLASKSQKDGER